MVYKGHIEHGTVVFDESVSLPDGTRVRIEVVGEATDIHPDVRRVTGILPRELDGHGEYVQGMLRKHQ